MEIFPIRNPKLHSCLFSNSYSTGVKDQRIERHLKEDEANEADTQTDRKSIIPKTLELNAVRKSDKNAIIRI